MGLKRVNGSLTVEAAMIVPVVCMVYSAVIFLSIFLCDSVTVHGCVTHFHKEIENLVFNKSILEGQLNPLNERITSFYTDHFGVDATQNIIVNEKLMSNIEKQLIFTYDIEVCKVKVSKNILFTQVEIEVKMAMHNQWLDFMKKNWGFENLGVIQYHTINPLYNQSEFKRQMGFIALESDKLGLKERINALISNLNKK